MIDILGLIDNPNDVFSDKRGDVFEDPRNPRTYKKCMSPMLVPVVIIYYRPLIL